MREVIATGKTVDEATEKACDQLGLSRDEVSVEILEMPIRRLFKTIPAKVCVRVNEEEVVSAPKEEAKPIAVNKIETEKSVSISEKKVVDKPKEQHRKVKNTSVISNEPEEPIDLDQNPAVVAAINYLKDIFSATGAVDFKVSAVKQGDATLLRVEGEDIANKIETRGETIQAISYLTDRAINKGVDKKDANYLRIRLDIAGYRGRREGELIALAKRTGKEVAQSKKSRTLAPMNPYERLIIHTTISEMDDVISESIGSDTERRVVIKSTAPDAVDGSDWRQPKSGGRPQQNRGNSGNRRGSNRNKQASDHRNNSNRPKSNTPEREYADKPRDIGAAPVVPERREAVKDGEDLPLYGKIEL